MAGPANLTTIELRTAGDTVTIIDQTLLPHRLEYRVLSTWEDAADAIAAMRVRGAALVGATAASGLALAVKADASDAAMFRAADGLRATRPAVVTLQWAVERCLSVLACTKPDERPKIAWAAAADIVREEAASNRSIGRYGLELIRAMADRRDGEPVRILTHGHAGRLTTTHLGTATAPIYLGHRAGIPMRVLVDESRPGCQGSALTAWELHREGIECDVLADGAGGLLMQRGDVDLVITGADRVAANGEVCNHIGTYLVALAARESEVPFCVAVPTSMIDPDAPDGSCIPIEHRDAEAVLHAVGRDDDGESRRVRVAADGVSALNPTFDITPASLVTVLITERGLLKPDTASRAVR
ncbi:MAG: S-methyl-5-thioribose-1-phosphate isomerase [Phycisphaerae bacterium]|nr:S-methyl-5-thioribose-1-phosphate isomerase [Phycisphaerae bacterium]